MEEETGSPQGGGGSRGGGRSVAQDSASPRPTLASRTQGQPMPAGRPLLDRSAPCDGPGPKPTRATRRPTLRVDGTGKRPHQLGYGVGSPQQTGRNSSRRQEEGRES
uniref:Uncharacterized protein n=1 Tax=Trieres chinensis TaxID=1514140 RepID=A0A7S2A5C7_TRICV